MAILLLLLFASVFASIYESKPYHHRSRDSYRPRDYFKRVASEVELQPCLDKLNAYRNKHGAGKLVWGKYEAENADKYAKQLASSGTIAKDPQDGVSDKEGESIYKVQGGTPAEKCIKAIDHWYSQVKKYVKSGGCDTIDGVEGTEDFTRMVWKSTDKIGLAVEGNIVDARYFPHGNFVEEFLWDVQC